MADDGPLVGVLSHPTTHRPARATGECAQCVLAIAAIGRIVLL